VPVIVAPGLTEVGVVNAKSLIVITAADELAVPDPAAGADGEGAPPPDEPGPQPARTDRVSAQMQASTTFLVGR